MILLFPKKCYLTSSSSTHTVHNRITPEPVLKDELYFSFEGHKQTVFIIIFYALMYYKN